MGGRLVAVAGGFTGAAAARMVLNAGTTDAPQRDGPVRIRLSPDLSKRVPASFLCVRRVIMTHHPTSPPRHLHQPGG